MKTFDVQSIGIEKSTGDVFDYVSMPENLPKWTNAFKSANSEMAELVTPAGEVPIKLKTVTSKAAGSVDWIMTFPDGSIGSAYSRVTPEGSEKSIFSFVLMAPPVPLEMLEGALQQQIGILAGELAELKTLLEA